MECPASENPAPPPGSNDRLHKAVLESTPDLVCVVDRAHRCVYANAAMLVALGRTRDEVIGRDADDFGYAPWDAAMHGVDRVFTTAGVVRGDAPFHGGTGRRVHEYML